MKFRLFLLFAVLICRAAAADLAIQISVDPGANVAPISPYIYGTNYDLDVSATPTARRLGGNRLTGYNWETNASNAGTDYLNESDNYMVYQLPVSQQSIPAIAMTDYHDQSLSQGTPYTVLTLQMAGYVSADESGVVTASQAAPSSRWDAVVNNKPGGIYDNPPDLTDGTVYMDELLNLIVTKYGPASGTTGVKGYNLDNEPSLWPSTHPLLHPAATTCAEEVNKSIALSTTIKRMDPTAEVLGPVLYGSEAYFTFQNAPDWASLQASTGDRWFIDYYLDQMNQASAAAGKRLLDVLDLHRYSDENVSGPLAGTAITSQTDFTDTATDMDRAQAPRVLWDPTFVENSWVGEYESQFLPYIPNLQASITAHYPGTKLSFTEYSYGGESDISGGLAQADVFGIYGKYGVYLACIWILHDTPAPAYISSAFNLYLNYDGQGGKFGATSIKAADSDTVNSSAYGSLDAAGNIHVVVLNKSYTQSADFTFTIAGSAAYPTASVYAFDSTSSTVTARPSATLTGNQVTYTLAPKTAAHFVFLSSASPPAVTVQPQSETIATGSTVVFKAAASGAPAPAYQWYLNGAPLSDGPGISGSAGATLVVSSTTAANAGVYTVVATNASGTAQSSGATLSVVATVNPGRLTNLSCRAQVVKGGSEIIGGFVVGGAGTSGTQSVLIRGSGPALGLNPFNIGGVLPDPQLTLYSLAQTPNTKLQSDTGWADNAAIASAASELGAFAWSATGADSAILTSLPAGNYSANIMGASGDGGIALAEIYDATPAGTYTLATPRLTNLSALVQVGTGAGQVYAGFVIGGSTAKTVLLRTSGPALGVKPFNLPGTLPDPKLTLNNLVAGTSVVVGANTVWGGDPQVQSVATRVGAFSWSGTSNDSALLMTLQPGNYTVGLVGASGDTGLALVEVYEVP